MTFTRIVFSLLFLFALATFQTFAPTRGRPLGTPLNGLIMCKTMSITPTTNAARLNGDALRASGTITELPAISDSIHGAAGGIAA